ncbi:MAG: addiction module protein [Pseudomonadota bacterium]
MVHGLDMRDVLSEALKLPARERMAIAEELLASIADDDDRDENERDDDHQGQDGDEEEIQAAWTEEIERRSRELRDGIVRGLSAEEARRIVASDPSCRDR